MQLSRYVHVIDSSVTVCLHAHSVVSTLFEADLDVGPFEVLNVRRVLAL